MEELHRGETSSPNAGIVEWVMANADGPSFATGEVPPAEKHQVFGVDFPAPDDSDLVALTECFQRNLWAIAR